MGVGGGEAGLKVQVSLTPRPGLSCWPPKSKTVPPGENVTIELSKTLPGAFVGWSWLQLEPSQAQVSLTTVEKMSCWSVVTPPNMSTRCPVGS